MRVAYIGNFGVSFSTESHVAEALGELGHEVVRLQENEVDWGTLSQTVADVNADFMLWTHTHGYAPESTHCAQQAALDELRQLGVPTVAYHLDKWWGLERAHQVHEPFFQCDVVVTADGGNDERWAEVGVNHVWMPPAVVASEVGRGKLIHRDERRDVGFVGSWKEYGHATLWPWRFELVSAVWNHYGGRFRAYPYGPRALRGWALNDVYASVKVMVGDSCLAGHAHHYWSDRVPETIGRGGFLLHPNVDGLDDAFPPSENLSMLTYDVGNIEQVFDLIDVWTQPGMDEQRQHRIDNGLAWVREHHTYTVRMRDVVALVEQRKANAS